MRPRAPRNASRDGINKRKSVNASLLYVKRERERGRIVYASRSTCCMQIIQRTVTRFISSLETGLVHGRVKFLRAGRGAVLRQCAICCVHVRIATLAIFRSPRDTSVEVVYGDIRCTRNYSFQIEENEKQIIIINYSSADGGRERFEFRYFKGETNNELPPVSISILKLYHPTFSKY